MVEASIPLEEVTEGMDPQLMLREHVLVRMVAPQEGAGIHIFTYFNREGTELYMAKRSQWLDFLKRLKVIVKPDKSTDKSSTS